MVKYIQLSQRPRLPNVVITALVAVIHCSPGVALRPDIAHMSAMDHRNKCGGDNLGELFLGELG